MIPIEHYSPVSGGAIATVTMHVVRELELMGHEVFVLAAEDGEPVYAHGVVRGISLATRGALGRVVDHLEARLRGWHWIGEGRYKAAVKRELLRLQPDAVVIANDLGGAELVRATVPSAKIISWLHNECPVSRRFESSIAQTDVFLCCSSYIREWFLARFGIGVHRVKTALAGVDQHQFFPSGADPSSTLRLLFVGRLDPNKGVDTTVAVASELKRKGVPVKLTVAGHLWFYRSDASIRNPFLRQLTIDMREGDVDWVGHVPRRWLPGLMREHDVVLVLSRSQEPFGLVVLEAMASGLVVVASPHGGLREACGEAGVFVDPEDQDSIQNILEDFCRDRSLLCQWRRRSLERASKASWRETANVFLRAVAECHRRF